MDKIDHKSRDILGGNVEKIAELFPGVVTEAQDETTGELKKVVDFDLLRQHLSDELVEGDRERFRLDWPGKKASILKANTPITKTLRPVREDSVDFDTTQNIFIEGDNFEVLKVLQESYLGKIKMIYIDPPYNTGKDFIYRDNFAQDREEYEEEIGVRDDENGGKLVKNTETNGRYHSDWLSMMQERLIVARDLLSDDGAIFISIGEDEQSNLNLLTREIFGESNYVTTYIWHNNVKGRQMDLHIKNTYEYVVVYAKNINSLIVNPEKNDVDTSGMETDDISPFEKGYPLHNGTADFHINNRPNLAYSIYYNPSKGDALTIDEKIGENGNYSIGGPSGRGRELIANGYVRIIPKYNNTYNNQRVWRWGAEKFSKEYKTELLFVEEGSGYYIYGKNRVIDGVAEKKPKNYLNIDGGSGKKDIVGIMEPKVFDNPKPVKFVKELLKAGSLQSDVILDFFSGSGTTAHAVMQLNAEDGGNRKHIQVQLAEPTDEKSEAYKAGYKTIPEISRERIRRAAKKIREDYTEQIAKRGTPLDTGFRAYKLSSSNFIDTAQHPAQTTQASLLDTTDNIKDDRTPEDLLTEVILDLGLTLDLPIEQRDIAGHSVFFVGGNSLVACFDDKVSLDIVDGIAAEKPLRVVFKDSSFANDETRINIDIRLKQLSPDTTVQVV